MKKCNYCSEEIQGNVGKCEHCNKWFEELAEPNITTEKNKAQASNKNKK